MIVFPENWKEVGVAIAIADIEDRLIRVLKEINCNVLSLSGGVDSSLLLYYMCKIFGHIKVFTAGLSKDHPDVIFAKSAVGYCERVFPYVSFYHQFYYPTPDEVKDTGGKKGFLGDKTVQTFYRFVAKYTDRIIAGDTIDEYMCGYYDHMLEPTEEMYYKYIRQLHENHLVPLNENSGEVKVYLPYADEKIIAMLSQIPLKDKVDLKNRKKVLMKLAKGKVLDDIIERRKYGFCDVLAIKEARS